MEEGNIIKLAAALCLVFFASSVVSDSYYSCYYGKELTTTEYNAYVSNSTSGNCTIYVVNCNETEGRRINGTCNNLNYPTYGGPHTPYFRFLDASYNKTTSSLFDPRLSADGSALKLARKLRTEYIADGVVPDDHFTHCVTHMAVFFTTDITNTRDTSNYVTWRPHCCDKEGQSDTVCAPNLVPSNDYIHRYTGIDCLNMTRPFSYQTSGCLANTTTPLRIVEATPLFDLSPIYGNVEESARRNYTNGTLNVETVDGTDFPITTGSLLLGINFIGIIFFWRFHNYIAQELTKINPCWSDNKTFSVSREINIAVANKIQYYDLWAFLLGRDKMIADGIISDTIDFRDMYNETVKPQMSIEYPVTLRWMHKMQDGTLKFYNSTGAYLNQSYPMVNLTSNINFIKQNGNMKYVTQGCFRQPSGKVDDHIADPDIINNGLSSLQKSNDIMTNDLAKSRYYGLDSYVAYRYFCDGVNITTFEELSDTIDDYMIDSLKEMFTDVKDIDYLLGLWLEKIMEDSYVPRTFYCIISNQLLLNIKADRFWFERESRPDAFTKDQLNQIHNSSMSYVLCAIGDSVTEIQPNSFELPGTDNEVVSCDYITAMDFTPWKDDSCDSDTTTTECPTNEDYDSATTESPTTTESDYYYYDDSTS